MAAQPRLELRDLVLVQAVAEEGGPTRAGARLHLTQSAVSHRIAELEERLGVSLFSRVRRRLFPTEAGKRLVAFAESALTEFARAEADVLSAANAKQRVRVATECFTCYHWLPPVLQELRAELPNVAVRIVVEATRRPLVALAEGKLELAIVSSPVEDKGLVVEPLFGDEWVVILPPKHALGARKFLEPKHLSGLTVFVHEASEHDARRMRELLRNEGAAIEFQVVPLTEALVELVRAGLGLGLMSRWAVANYVSRGLIETRRFTRGGLREHWSAVYSEEAAERLPLARLAQILRKRTPGVY
ncbi:MAG: LysR family transcriptional regulator [Polyangiaceae bacterium]